MIRAVLAVALLAVACGAHAQQGDSFNYSGRDQFKHQTMLKMESCIAEETPQFMYLKSRSAIRAMISKLCTGEMVGMGYMTQAQATALSDRMTNAEISALLANR